MKTKKSTLRILTFILTFSFIFSGVFSQDKKEKRIIKIKTDNGKVILDTIIANKGEAFFLDEEMLKKLDFDEETISIWSTSVDDKDSIIRLMVKSVKDSDDSFIFTIKDGNADVGDKDYKVISLTSSCGKIDIDGDTDSKTIILKSYGKEGDSSCYVYVTDFADGDNTKKMSILMDGKCKIKKGEESFVYAFGYGDDNILYINCLTGKDLDEKDIETLKDAGISYEKDELELGELIFFPNPSDGEFNLKFNLEEEGDVKINIIDFNGKVIFKEKLKNFSEQYDKKIDIKEQPAGTYFLNVQQNGKMSTSKIIITD